MPDKPLSPFVLTPARITLLILGVFAIIMIAGGIFGGVANYALLKQGAAEQSSSEAPSQ